MKPYIDIWLSVSWKLYTAFGQHFGSDVTSASFAFNWSRGHEARLTHAVRCHGARMEQAWRHYQSMVKCRNILFKTWLPGSSIACERCQIITNSAFLSASISFYPFTTISKTHFGPEQTCDSFCLIRSHINTVENLCIKWTFKNWK